MIKDFFRSFLQFLARTLAFSFGMILFIVMLSVLFKKPYTTPTLTTAHVLPNHEWKQAPLSTTAPTILRLNVNGIIGLDGLKYQNIRDQLIDSIDGQIKQEQVKGILIVLNTPGGAADDSDAIYRLVKEYKARYKVPVWAVADGLCASGGMYIACSADKIYATEPSVLGSVGVIMGTGFNFSALMERVGVQSKTLFCGKNKDELNPFRPWTPEEGSNIQHTINSFYDKFVGIVTENRKEISKEQLIEMGAQVYPVEDAKQIGFIDGIVQHVDQVLHQFAKELNIEEKYQFVELKSESLFEELFKSGENALFQRKIRHEVVVPGALPQELQGKMLFLYNPQQST